MEKNEIKKVLYKENPEAKFVKIVKGVAYYVTVCSLGNISFTIPVDDMGDAEFVYRMEAKLLIRYISKEPKTEE